MHKLPKMLLLMLGLVLLAVAVSFLTTTPAPAAPNSVPVTVVNTPSQPVPTAAQGITAISGNVGIANVPERERESNTRCVVRDHTPTQPFHIHMCADYGTESGSCLTSRVPPANSTFQVPTITSDGHAVERMVIENVSASCESFGQQVFEVLLDTSLSENSPNPTLTDVFPASASASPLIQTVSQQTRIYADPGSLLRLSFGITGTPANGTVCGMVLTGYLTTQTP